MLIGVPREVKDHETRVGIVPSGVRALVDAGHKVVVETGAGALSSMTDEDFRAAGADILSSATDVWKKAEMVVKVKEPVSSEFGYFRENLVLFTIRDNTGALPLLTPMSEVAGRMSVQVGASYLEYERGGRGVLLGGVPGVPPAQVCIIGGGIVGTNAAKIALGMGAIVSLIDLNLNRLRELDDIFNGRLYTLASNSYTIAKATQHADLVIGAVLIPGASAPKLVTREMVSKMKQGAVIVDVAIDQGGCIATARPTTHSEPSYVVDGVVHYCVTNISTLALTNATFPYVMKLAQRGVSEAIREDAAIREGVNTHRGHVTYAAVAESQKRPHKDVLQLL
jgi:alanine dehydrogenase